MEMSHIPVFSETERTPAQRLESVQGTALFLESAAPAEVIGVGSRQIASAFSTRTPGYLCFSRVLKRWAMESELTIFLTTIDTPAFRRNNLAKVRAKAAAAQGSSEVRLSAPVPGIEPTESALPTTRSEVAMSGK